MRKGRSPTCLSAHSLLPASAQPAASSLRGRMGRAAITMQAAGCSQLESSSSHPTSSHSVSMHPIQSPSILSNFIPSPSTSFNLHPISIPSPSHPSRARTVAPKGFVVLEVKKIPREEERGRRRKANQQGERSSIRFVKGTIYKIHHIFY